MGRHRLAQVCCVAVLVGLLFVHGAKGKEQEADQPGGGAAPAGVKEYCAHPWLWRTSEPNGLCSVQWFVYLYHPPCCRVAGRCCRIHGDAMLTLFARGASAVWNEVTGETQWEDPGGENARAHSA